MKKLNRKGFTLIELLAVIVILGILMLIAIPSVTRYINKSRQGTFKNTAQLIIDSVRTDAVSHQKTETCWIKVDKDSTQLEKGNLKNINGYITVSRASDGTYDFRIDIVDPDYDFRIVATEDNLEDLEYSDTATTGFYKDATTSTVPTPTTPTGIASCGF